MARPFVLEDEVHQGDDEACPACATGYPQACSCGGLIHAAGEADEDSEVISTTRCDSCGRSKDDLEGEEEPDVA